VEIDYAARLLPLYDPATYVYSGQGEVIPLEVAPQQRERPECGLGGYAKETALEGTLPSVRLGNREVRDPAAVFSQIDENVPYDGFLGGGVLRNFTTIFDFSRRRMILETPR
jgi:hypothetical protein